MAHKNNTILFLLCCFFLSYSAHAQTKLSLREAIEIGLKNNYAIKLSRNEHQITINNVSRGNAGFLPNIDLNGGSSFSNANTRQEFLTGNTLNRNGAQSFGINAGIQANWVVFDGMRMFAVYDGLKQQQEIGKLNMRESIEQAAEEIISKYAELVAQELLLIAIDSLIDVYTEQVTINERRLKIGMAGENELLQSKIDLNAQKSILIQQKINTFQLKQQFNMLLGRKPDEAFEIEPELKIEAIPDISVFRKGMQENNNSLQLAKMNVSINENELKVLRSDLFPQIALNGSYTFGRTQNQAGFLLFNQNLGFQFGINASWRIFNGMKTKITTENANLRLLNTRLILEAEEQRIASILSTAMLQYSMAMEMLRLEGENKLMSDKNLQIVLARYRLRQSTSIELKEAVKTREDAAWRYASALVAAKKAETILLRIKGELVKFEK